jgi:hypothetical protein
MTELSPAAEAALSAYYEEAIDYIEEWGTFKHKRGLAATLRAVADQVVPAPRCPYHSCCDVYAAAIRAELLAIAVELEAQ